MEQRAHNPFHARTQQQRDENFPPFEEAFAPATPRPAEATQQQQGEATAQAATLNQSECSSSNSEANLSIGARSALNAHNRHIHRFGLDQDDDDHDDDEDEEEEEDNDETGQVGAQHGKQPHDNSLDAEWDRLNNSELVRQQQQEIFERMGQVESNLNDSSASSSSFGTTSRYRDRVVASHSESGEEAIEVLTAVSVDHGANTSSISDYFNSSRAQLLLTPESVRNAPVVAHQQIPLQRFGNSLLLDDSHASSVNSAPWNDEEIRMRQLFRMAGLPSPSSSEYAATRNDNNSVHAAAVTAATQQGQDTISSFSLNLSHISADGSDTGQGGVVDLSLNQSILSNDPLIAIEEVVREYHPNTHSNNSSGDSNYNNNSIHSRNGRTRVRNKVLPFLASPTTATTSRTSISPRRRTYQNYSSSSSSSSSQRKLPATPAFQMRRSSPTALSPWGTPPRFASSPEEISTTSTVYASAMASLPAVPPTAASSSAALSPLSRQAADRAREILRSDDWKSTSKIAPAASLYSFPVASFPNSFDVHDSNCSDSASQDNGSVVVAMDGRYDISTEIIDDDNDNDTVSPLHSSTSEEQQKTKKDSSGTISSRSAKSHLKDKTSLSSISPDSSSSPGNAQGTSRQLAPAETASSPLPKPVAQRSSSFGSTSNRSFTSMVSFGEGDRRRFRTVVPTRVFCAEPRDFPDNNDSFSVPPPLPTDFSPRRVWSVAPDEDREPDYYHNIPTDEHGFPIKAKQSLGANGNRGGDTASAPARTQSATVVPIVSPEVQRRLGERSVRSGPL